MSLVLTATPAMRAGRQLVFQCSDCGLLAVQSDLAPGPLGGCPACGGSKWWRQEIPPVGSADSLAGLQVIP